MATLISLLALSAFPSGALALDRAQVARSLDRSMDRARTGLISAQVRDLASGETIYARQPSAARVPASVTKLFTTAASLRLRGSGARLVTRVVREGGLSEGRLEGDLFLVGGGDPTLDAKTIARLARSVRRAGIERVTGSVLGDESRFDARRGGPRTAGLYDRDMGGVLGALTVGRGFSRRAGGPALAAARTLARALRSAGVVVAGRTSVGIAPAGARTVTQARSVQLGELVRLTNQPSDNFYAEALLKDLGTISGLPGSTEGGAALVRRELAGLGVAPALVDGSGLSRSNRASAADVVQLIAAMRGTTSAETFEASLAVAGRSGTLRRRLRGTPAAGACRAKTGTLNRVSALAGLCVTREGRTLAFALLMDDVALWRAHMAQDRALRALVAYRSLL